MNPLSIMFDVITQVWWLIPAFLIAVVLKSRFVKGVIGEQLVKQFGRQLLPESTYMSFHDVTLPIEDGTTQIDHIYVSKYGVFVVETKNMRGWIFGSEKQAQWTQKIYKQSFKFQNPLRQNYKHTKTIESAIDVPADTVHSVVVFTGESIIKTPMPENVTQGIGFAKYIKSFKQEVLTNEQVEMVCDQLKEGRLEPSFKTHRQHVKNLKEAQKEKTQNPWCPKCGSQMAMRTSKKGLNAGNQFWGCTNYPKCRGVLPIG